MKFDDKILAYIQSNQDSANELFKIAKQHKMTYMALNERAMNIYKPILEWFEKKELYKDAREYAYKNIPDCLDLNLYMMHINYLEKQKEK